LAAVTDLDMKTCILIMGVLSIVYCVAGGISAVIWTDVAQSFVLLGGALLSLVLILAHTEGGIGGFVHVAVANEKFRLVDWTWDITTTALWLVIFGNLFGNLVPYMTDQAVVQRYMTTRDEKTAARSIWLNAIIAMPAGALFFLVGTALFVYFKQYPERLTPGFQNDAVFPIFIAWQLPAGIAGIVVAGIFAAAQSTVSTSMNSMSTVLVKDFFFRLKKGGLSGRAELVLARWFTGILGVLGTLGALLLASYDIKSLWDVFFKLLGLTGSSLAGLFLLGIFTRRVGGTAAMIGAVVSIFVLYFVQKYTPIHFFLYAAVGSLTCIVVGYLASMMFEAPAAETLRGLTFHTLRKSSAVEEIGT
jgi:Na+/proline symporter